MWKKKLNLWLSRFVVEARWKDGEPYPRSIYLLLSGLLRHGHSNPKLFLISWIRTHVSRSSLVFVGLQLHKDGVGASVKHAPIVTFR